MVWLRKETYAGALIFQELRLFKFFHLHEIVISNTYIKYIKLAIDILQTDKLDPAEQELLL